MVRIGRSGQQPVENRADGNDPTGTRASRRRRSRAAHAGLALVACGGLGVGTALTVAVPGVAAVTGPATKAAPAHGEPAAAVVAAHGLGLLGSPGHQAPVMPTHLFGHVALPTSVNLSSDMPSAGNQGALGSCVSWAVGYTLYGYYVRTEHLTGGDHAPMYLYSQVQLPGGGSDFVGDVGHPGNLDTAKSQGVDTEADYPQGYYNDTTLPTAAERANAAHYKITAYQTLFAGAGQAGAATAIETALAGGNPVVLGIPVYSPGFDETSYDYPGPTSSDYFRGNHAVVAVGYDSYGIIIENSWGTSWGRNGFADLSYSFVDNDVFAAYTISGITTQPAPTVTQISRASGPTAGGTSITITGTGFAGATAVDFGAAAAHTFTVASATSITAVSPAGTGTVDVTVTTPNGTSQAVTADRFTYQPPPTVTGMSHTSGPKGGGTSITITGTGFAGATAVHFGAAAAHTFTVASATSITAVSPAGTGTVDVTVTTPNGTSQAVTTDRFTY